MASEKRLIDANEAVKAVTDIYCGTAGYRARERLWQAVEAVKEITTVDAVPVVRCKDCKHYVLHALACRNEHMNGVIDINGFCSYGEKRGDFQ